MKIKPTRRTPGITFEDSIFKMEGCSYPENVLEFYSPVIAELKEKIEECENSRVQVNFSLAYFNSSSYRMLKKIILLFDGCGKEVTFNWFYNDCHMQDYGDVFRTDVKSEFNLIGDLDD